MKKKIVLFFFFFQSTTNVSTSCAAVWCSITRHPKVKTLHIQWNVRLCMTPLLYQFHTKIVLLTAQFPHHSAFIILCGERSSIMSPRRIAMACCITSIWIKPQRRIEKKKSAWGPNRLGNHMKWYCKYIEKYIFFYHSFLLKGFSK